MKLSRKQIMSKLLSFEKILLLLLICAGFIFIFTSLSFAPTKMSDSELSDIEGQAALFQITQFTNATMSTAASGWPGTDSANVIRLSLNIDVEILSHMKSFKMGYYSNGGGVTGWDQDVTNYFWGDPSRTGSSLLLQGLFIDFGFDNLGDSATRTLNYIEAGSKSVTGNITGSLNTLNAMVSAAGTGQNNGVLIRQTASGVRTVHFDNNILSFVFATKYRYTNPTDSKSKQDLSGIFVKLPGYDSDNTT